MNYDRPLIVYLNDTYCVYQAVYDVIEGPRVYLKDAVSSFVVPWPGNGKNISSITGHTFLGRYIMNGLETSAGEWMLDSLAIWDRVLSEEEREMLLKD